MSQREFIERKRRKSVVPGTDQGDGKYSERLGQWYDLGDEDNERGGKDGEGAGIIGCSKISRLVGKEERSLHIHEWY